MYPNLEQKISVASSGEELTQLIRSLAFEGLGDYAHTRMKEAIPALSDDKIRTILMAEKTLTGGLERMSIIDEQLEISKRFNKDLAFVTRGLFRHSDGKLYRPHGYVASYCQLDALCTKRQSAITMEVFEICDYDEDEHKTLLRQDIKRTLKKSESLLDRLDHDPAYRVKHYAKSDDDLALFIDCTIPDIKIGPRIGILCEHVTDEPPAFFNCIHATPDEAFAQMIEKHRNQIQPYGYRLSYTGLFGHGEQRIADFSEPLLDDADSFDIFYKADDLFFKAFTDLYYQDTKQKVLAASMLDTYGWIELRNEECKLLATVPKLPFMHWAFNQTKGVEKLPKYEAISCTDLKNRNDSRFHSDWMIGAGLSLTDDYGFDSPVQSAAIITAHKMQINELKFECMVLSSGKSVTGHIKYCTLDNANTVKDGDIVVIPKGSAEYQLHVQAATRSGAGGVIAIMANRVAHLVKVSKEFGITMMLKPNALDSLPEGYLVTLNPDDGTIKLVSIS